MKISSPYPAEINEALKQNLPGIEFSPGAEINLPLLPLPVRLGEILDYIDSLQKNIHIGNFLIDTGKNTISAEGKTLELTEKEAAILKFLSQNKTTVTRETMLKTIWGYSDTVDSKTVENHIYRLRQKIQSSFGSEIIITENNGYKLIEN